MPKIVLIRHLPTPWNEQGLLQGLCDIDILTPNKVVFTKILHNKEKLLNIFSTGIHQVYCSELVRTQSTAKLYGYNDFIINPLLNELNFGDFEGNTKQQLLDRYQTQWLESPKGLDLGESILNLEVRVNAFTKGLDQNSNVLIFGHGAWIRALKAIVELKDLNKMNSFNVGNNEIIEVSIESISNKL